MELTSTKLKPGSARLCVLCSGTIARVSYEYLCWFGLSTLQGNRQVSCYNCYETGGSKEEYCCEWQANAEVVKPEKLRQTCVRMLFLVCERSASVFL